MTTFLSTYQVYRGKNWSDEETQLFIKVLKENYSSMQARRRKGKVFERMAYQLKGYGIERSPKEVQNKYKSIMAEYRNALASNKGQNNHNYKWFHLLNSFMQITHSNKIEGYPTPTSQSQNYEARQQESAVISGGSHENLEAERSKRTFHSNNKFLDDSNQSTRKRKWDNNEVPFDNAKLQIITEELKQYTETSAQAQENICNSIQSFSQMVENLSGTLSLVSSMITQFMQNRPYQSYPTSSQQNQQTVVFSPTAPQLVIQESDIQNNNPQYFLLYNQPTMNN